MSTHSTAHENESENRLADRGDTNLAAPTERTAVGVGESS